MLRCTIVGLATLGLLCGCGGGEGETRVPTVPIKGHLYIDGKSYGPALLNLTISPPDPKIPVVNAYVKQDGTFTCKTYVEDDGAPPGTYDVRLTMDPMNMGMMPDAKPTKVEIKKPGSGPLDLEIKLESSGKMISPLPPPGQEAGPR